MCRHFAYIGPPVLLDHLVAAPPNGLLRQSYQPRRQKHGTVNADGFGVGWYSPGTEQPQVYRRGVPIWSDVNLTGFTTRTRSGAVLGAVRSATPPLATLEPASAPFSQGSLLFSHNGALPGWPESAQHLADKLPWPAIARQQVLTDSTLMWAWLLHRLENGAGLPEAVADLTREAREIHGARVNLLVHDGTRVVATAAGDTLFYLSGELPGPDGRPAPGVIVASEPFDDVSEWVEVADDSILIATPSDVTVHQLATFRSETP